MKTRPITELLSQRTFRILWTTVYFRTLPLPLNEIDDDYLDFFFMFANTYTEESVLTGYIKSEEKKEKEVADDALKELGYTDKDIM